MIVGIKLNDNGKTYYFNSNGFNLNDGDNVIVETEKGLQFGEVTTTNIDESKNNDIDSVLRKINILIDSKDSIKFNVNSNLLMDSVIISIGGVNDDSRY